MNHSQRRELSSGLFHRSHGSFELVLSPLLFALLGLWIDGRIGTTPLVCITFAVLGFAGVVAKLYYTYRAGMQQLADQRRAPREHVGPMDEVAA